MRSQISLKSNTCPEGVGVYATGIRVKGVRITRGDLLACHVLPTLRDVGMGGQKSAEGIVGPPTGLKA